MKAFVPFIIIAICIGMYFMYIEPMFAEITTLNEKKAEYTNVLDKTKELKTQRDIALSKYNSIGVEDLEKLDKVIPSTFDSAILANDLNTLASKYGMFIKGFKSNKSNVNVRDVEATQISSEQYKTTSVTLELIGGYEQFLKFLQDVESSLRLVDVINLTVKQAGVQKSGDSLEYSLEIYTYSLK